MTRREDESRGFIEAIRDAPEDDTHRLVYADWLEDHGDSDRAEFIRVQCELARPPRTDGEPSCRPANENYSLRTGVSGWGRWARNCNGGIAPSAGDSRRN